MLVQEHEDTLSSMGIVELAYNLGGRWEDAEELFVQVMEIGETPGTLTSMANLAFARKAQGRVAEAACFMRESGRLLQRILGVDHPSYVSSSAASVGARASRR